jgi:hypothetical protein
MICARRFHSQAVERDDRLLLSTDHNPDINITFLQSVSDPRVNIEVRETPDEILSASST